MTSPINLRPLALPYYDPTTGETGMQFGMPTARQEDPLAQEFAKEAGMDILLLPDEGAPRRVYHPKLYAPHVTEKTSEPPRPVWAWHGVEIEGQVLYARVVPPGHMQGSQPLSTIETRRAEPLGGSRRFIATPRGLAQFRMPARPWDVLAHEIVGFEDDLEVLTIGNHHLAIVHSEGGYVLAIEPSELAVELGLWSSHLLRLLDVTRQQYQEAPNERQAEHTSLDS